MDVLKNLLWILVLSGMVPAWAGTIQGQVSDMLERGVADVSVWLDGDGGTRLMGQTDEWGFFRFDMLPPDSYTLGILVPDGYLIETPPCGYQRLSLELDEDAVVHFKVRKRGSGVVVEFGKPNGSESAGFPILEGNIFEVILSAYNLDDYAPDFADTLYIEGKWFVPDHGPVQVVLIGAEPIGMYANAALSFTFENLGNWAELRVRRIQSPHFDQDGEIAKLTFRILDPDVIESHEEHKLTYCMDEVSQHWQNTELGRSRELFIGLLP